MYPTVHRIQQLFPRGLKGIIFDCDGVLFDSRASNIQYYNLILGALGQPPMSPEDEDYTHMASVGQSLARIVPPALMPKLPEARKRIVYRRDILPLLEPEPGLMELLRWLRDAGFRRGICTNRTTTMEYVLDHFGMTELFFPVMTAARVRAKPHPEGLCATLDAWGLARDEVAFIGDTIADQETARMAGVCFWAYRSPALTARLHLDDFWALRRVLAEYGRGQCGRERGHMPGQGNGRGVGLGRVTPRAAR